MGTIFQVNESNGNATITGSLTMSSQQIHSVADPTSAQDATTKNYVDTIAQGITWKASVQAATTAALPTNTYNNGASGVGATLTAVAPGVLTVDGYTVALNDRLLIKNEATAANNGIYFVSTLGTVSVAYILTRTLDYDTPADVVAGTATFVEQGTVNSDSGFVQTTTGTIIIGTSALSFTQFTGLGEVTAGTGLSKSGNTISLINPVAVNLGGTGLATLTAHDVLVGNGTSNITLISPSTSTFALVSNGTSADPSFQAIVNSITGTSNEITASSSTGSVTLSVPSTFIAPGSIAATTTLSGTSETLTNTTNQLVLGTTNTTTISSTAPSASRTYTIPDAGSAANMVLDKGNYTIGGTWTFSNNITLASSKALVLTDNTTNTVSVQATNSTTSWTLKLPTTSGSSNFFLQTDGSGNTTWASGGSGTVNNSTAAALAYYATSGTSISQFPALSPGTALVSDVSGLPANSITTATELTYVSGVTSAIQTQLNGKLATSANKVIQIVNSSSSTATTTTSTSYVATNLSATITPTSSSNKILIIVSGNGNMISTTTVNIFAAVTVFRGATDIGGASGIGFQQIPNVFSNATTQWFLPVNIHYVDAPATTSALTYTVQIKVNNAALSVAWGQTGTGGNLPTTLTVMEVVA